MSVWGRNTLSQPHCFLQLCAHPPEQFLLSTLGIMLKLLRMVLCLLVCVLGALVTCVLYLGGLGMIKP